MMATKWHHAARGELAADGAPLAASVEKSLQRLATDHIDIIQFHGLHVHEYHEAVKRFYPTMKQLQQDGKVRFIGFSEPYPGNSDPKQETTALALSTHPELWDTIMIKYGIINQLAAKEALPLAEKHGVGILNMAAVRLKLTRPDQLAELMADWEAERPDSRRQPSREGPAGLAGPRRGGLGGQRRVQVRRRPLRRVDGDHRDREHRPPGEERGRPGEAVAAGGRPPQARRAVQRDNGGRGRVGPLTPLFRCARPLSRATRW